MCAGWKESISCSARPIKGTIRIAAIRISTFSFFRVWGDFLTTERTKSTELKDEFRDSVFYGFTSMAQPITWRLSE